MEKETILRIFREIKPDFLDKLGKYTHQRITDYRHFHGLAFVKDELTYLFGFNVGFFGTPKEPLTHIGMNVLVRTNGEEQEYRKKLFDFFEKNLENWYIEEGNYTSFRGGIGTNFSRTKKISSFKNEDEIIEFIKNGIIELQKIYPEIIKNPDNIFDDVLRAGYPWLDTIGDVCNKVLKNPIK